jgi:hypothetical protein
MGRLFEKHEAPCGRWQAWSDGNADAVASPRNLQQLLASLSPDDRAHFLACEDCRVLTEAWLAVRESLQALPQSAPAAPPWFAARVIAVIAAREEESRPAATWIAVPRFASRLALASAALLFAATTWLYQRPPARPSTPPAVSSSEGLFDTQPPAVTEDEVLSSFAEKNHE